MQQTYGMKSIVLVIHYVVSFEEMYSMPVTLLELGAQGVGVRRQQELSKGSMLFARYMRVKVTASRDCAHRVLVHDGLINGRIPRKGRR